MHSCTKAVLLKLLSDLSKPQTQASGIVAGTHCVILRLDRGVHSNGRKNLRLHSEFCLLASAFSSFVTISPASRRRVLRVAGTRWSNRLPVAEWGFDLLRVNHHPER